VLNAFFDYVANCQGGVIVVMMMMMMVIIIIIIMLNGYIALLDLNLLISIHEVMQETLT
jgi:hypothetical protein